MAQYLDVQWVRQELVPLLAYAYRGDKQYVNRSLATWESDIRGALSEIGSIVSTALYRWYIPALADCYT